MFALVCDKRKIFEQSGLRFKSSFYKFINNLAYQELRAVSVIWLLPQMRLEKTIIYSLLLNI